MSGERRAGRPSRLWILVHDRERGDEVVVELPTTEATLEADLAGADARYPLPRYSVTTAGSSVPTATGTELLAGWDHDGFDEAGRNESGDGGAAER